MRNAEKEQRRMHVPMVEQDVTEPPPLVVLVQGPPGVGKTTLIRNLVKHYVNQSLGEVKGPITLVAGKTRRLTFVECPQDLNGMIDAAKYADLVLLMIDGGFGFEMETFEFLNILQASITHGFPKVMGVLTHLDSFKDQKRLKKTKKTLKHRFWAEIYQGAKLFYLSGMKNGRYMKREVLNLARFISVMKFRPLSWRQTHPFLLADRFEDITPVESIRENPKCDRDVTVYGYLRGANMRQGTRVHLAGVGDKSFAELDQLPDPCPLPSTVKKRGLNEKERMLYAPMADVGGLMYDKDAVYINIPDWKVQYSADGTAVSTRYDPGGDMVRELQATSTGMDERLQQSQIRLFQNGTPLQAGEQASALEGLHDESPSDEDSEGSDSSNEEGEGEDELSSSSEDEAEADGPASIRQPVGQEVVHASGRKRRSALPQCSQAQYEGDSEEEEPAQDWAAGPATGSLGEAEGSGTDDSGAESDDSEGLGRAAKWKANMLRNAAALFSNRAADLQSYVYGEVATDTGTKRQSDQDEDELFKPRGRRAAEDTAVSADAMDALDSCRVTLDAGRLQQWQDAGSAERLRNRFVTGDWDAAGQRDAAQPGEGDSQDSDADAFGEFEDMETGKRFGADGDAATATALQGEGEDGEGETYYDAMKQEMGERAARTKAAMDALHPLQRVAMEGHRAGTYVRLRFTGLPCELLRHFTPSQPLLVGGLTPAEEGSGFMQLRFKRHRWFPKIMKTRDPLIFSIGWRRFQSLPVFATEDANGRQRMLKYTPEHMHCLAAVWGPLAPPNTGVIAIQNPSNDQQNWRISATGVVLQLGASLHIVKKLKLRGEPFRIHRHTAFVGGMFNSRLEVAKFEGAGIRTVSGIRGIIKKALRPGVQGAKDGAFRATFEDKPLMSDIIFLRAWVAVDLPRFANPVTNLLAPTNMLLRRPKPGLGWSSMRTVAQMRRDLGIGAPRNTDSLYKPIERAPRQFNPLKIPRALQAELPFKSKPKQQAPRKNPTLDQKRAVKFREPAEKKAASLVHALSAIRNAKLVKRREQHKRRQKEHAKKVAAEEAWRAQYNKEERKKRFRDQGKAEAHAAKRQHK
eukprot:jgi/Astpho2/4383/e_gw1.00067.3.1_t